jgi:hypothetical protein
MTLRTDIIFGDRTSDPMDICFDVRGKRTHWIGFQGEGIPEYNEINELIPCECCGSAIGEPCYEDCYMGTRRISLRKSLRAIEITQKLHLDQGLWIPSFVLICGPELQGFALWNLQWRQLADAYLTSTDERSTSESKKRATRNLAFWTKRIRERTDKELGYAKA